MAQKGCRLCQHDAAAWLVLWLGFTARLSKGAYGRFRLWCLAWRAHANGASEPRHGTKCRNLLNEPFWPAIQDWLYRRNQPVWLVRVWLGVLEAQAKSLRLHPPVAIDLNHVQHTADPIAIRGK